MSDRCFIIFVRRCSAKCALSLVSICQRTYCMCHGTTYRCAWGRHRSTWCIYMIIYIYIYIYYDIFIYSMIYIWYLYIYIYVSYTLHMIYGICILWKFDFWQCPWRSGAHLTIAPSHPAIVIDAHVWHKEKIKLMGAFFFAFRIPLRFCQKNVFINSDRPASIDGWIR